MKKDEMGQHDEMRLNGNMLNENLIGCQWMVWLTWDEM